MKRILTFLGKRMNGHACRLSTRQIESLCDGDRARTDPEARRRVTLEQVLESASSRFPG
jgi:hypothetical protein